PADMPTHPGSGHSDEDGSEEGEEEDAQEDEDEDVEEGSTGSDISCFTDSDCMSYEACMSGICQIDRCSDNYYESSPPMGEYLLFNQDLEFAIVDEEESASQYWLDGYSPTTTGAPFDSSWSAGNQRILDVAGGDFLGTAEQTYAVSTENTNMIQVLYPGSPVSVSAPFTATAMVGASLDDDSADELLLGTEHRLAVCNVDINSCFPFWLDTQYQILDVAAGDLDGDFTDEAVILVSMEDDLFLQVLNLSDPLQGPVLIAELPVDAGSHKVASADIDADEQGEIIVLEEGGWWNWNDDEFAVYEFIQSDDSDPVLQLTHHQESGYGRLKDLDAGDTDGDEQAELIALDEHQKVGVFTYQSGAISRLYESEFNDTEEPDRIAMADHDNNSTRADLVAGPESVVGAEVPVIAMLLPPFSYEHSAGFSSTGYGMGDTMSETFSDTVSLSVGVDVGIKGSFLGVFGTSFSEKVGWRVSETLGTTSTMATGTRSSIRSQPDDFGFHYGAVVVSWGCFHAYTYEVQDPTDLINGSDEEEIVLTVPVDAGTAMLSTGRYNAMALAVGDLPVIEPPYTVGDVYSYPTQPETIWGEAIPDEDYVFPGLDWYEVSDVGYVGWFNTFGQASSNASTESLDMGASASVTVAGVTVGLNSSMGWGKGYSLSMGETALFSGAIPPFRDDPATAVDEYAENFFRVAPITYVQHYEDADGNDAAFYVQTYVVDYD
ncbi:MAG TPA: hypothetical protein DIU15_09720, partial [Deltaproteobacteria bacterium]|nr:hypothetical protein [Deltaproteobacteria bacterium]